MQNTQKSEVDLTQDELELKMAKDAKLRESIMLAIDIEGAFKLYSYRCISPDQFISRVEELVNFYEDNSREQDTE